MCLLVIVLRRSQISFQVSQLWCFSSTSIVQHLLFSNWQFTSHSNKRNAFLAYNSCCSYFRLSELFNNFLVASSFDLLNRKPEPTSTREEKEMWIRAKYDHQEFLPPLPYPDAPLQQQLIDAIARQDTRQVVLCLALATPDTVNAPYSRQDPRAAIHIAATLGNLVYLQLLLWVSLIISVSLMSGFTDRKSRPWWYTLRTIFIHICNYCYVRKYQREMSTAYSTLRPDIDILLPFYDMPDARV